VNPDGVVTWKEYYHSHFLMRPCSPGPAPFPSGFRDENLRGSDTLSDVTFCEEDEDFQRAIGSHREKELTQDDIGGVEVQCAAPVPGKPPYIGYVMGRCSPREDGDSSNEQAYYSRISIRNENVDATISAVTSGRGGEDSLSAVAQKAAEPVAI
jgi:hypothetical protein